jgi:hypothetical protein
MPVKKRGKCIRIHSIPLQIIAGVFDMNESNITHDSVGEYVYRDMFGRYTAVMHGDIEDGVVYVKKVCWEARDEELLDRLIRTTMTVDRNVVKLRRESVFTT